MSPSVAIPHGRRTAPPESTATAPSTPAPASTPISTVVSGPSCRPPRAISATATSSAASPTVVSVPAPTRGSARGRSRASVADSAGAACVDTRPERRRAVAEQARGDQREDDQQRGRQLVAARAEVAEAQRSGGHELAGDLHGLAPVDARLRQRLALLRRGVGQRVDASATLAASAVRRAAATGAGGSAAGAVHAAALAPG